MLAVLILLMIAPLFFSKLTGNSLDQLRNVPLRYGPFHFLSQKIYEEKGDIDIAFFGSSAIWTSIDAKILSTQLSKDLGRNVTVYNFGSNWLYDNLTYDLALRTLGKRKIKLAIIELHSWANSENEEHPGSFYFSDFFTIYPLIKDSPLLLAKYYGHAFLGFPRAFVGMIFNNKRSGLTKSSADLLKTYLENNGSYTSELGWQSYDSKKEREPFTPYRPTTPHIPISQMLYRHQDDDPRRSKDSIPLSQMQKAYLRQIYLELKRNGGKLAFIDVDNNIGEENLWLSRKYNDDLFEGNIIPLVKVRSQTLLENFSDDQKKLLNYNERHRNKNGAEFFTKTVYPAIKELYE